MGQSTSAQIETRLISGYQRSPEQIKDYLGQLTFIDWVSGGYSGDKVALVNTDAGYRILKLFHRAKDMYRECKIQSQFKHAPTVYNCFPTANIQYKNIKNINGILEMEYLDGWETLNEVDLTPELKHQVCRVVNELHNIGVIHSDLHKGNIMVKNGDVKIIDFGNASIIGSTHPRWRLNLTDIETMCLHRNIFTSKGIVYSQIDYTKESVLILDIGTFCDFALMDTVSKELQQSFNIINISPQPNAKFCNVHYPMTVPLLTEITKHIAKHVDVTRGIKHIIQNLDFTTLSYVYAYYGAMRNVSRQIENIAKIYNVSHIVAHPGQTLAIYLGYTLKSIAVSVVYYAPGYLPNQTYNNPFGDQMSELSPQMIREQTRNYEKAFTYIAKFQNPFAKVQHILCYDQPLIKCEEFTTSLQTVYLGSLYPSLRQQDELPSSIKQLLDRSNNKTKVLVTFGSFLKPYEAGNFLSTLIRKITAQDCAIIFIGQSNQVQNSEFVVAYDQFLSYDLIVPQCDVILFTGSVCLQNVSWKHRKRMGFIPYLSEQFLWAKEYQRLTNIPFINTYSPASLDENLTLILTQPQPDVKVTFYDPLTKYLSTVIKSWKLQHAKLQFKEKKLITPKLVVALSVLATIMAGGLYGRSRVGFRV
uniref:Protein kinase domain-containing protein n=1 Tax=viral metagenome TaxID=1070528 RepID=A0A6C0BRR6_9ZZZZ